MALHKKDISTAAKGVDLQHRHFAFIAATIKSMDGSHDYRREIARDFANACAATNPRFDRGRFLAAAAQQES
jgi:hypothetical protein